ncbi:hypothetical protein ACJMK2_034767 [Sinanodonta woodiana]|uniref:Ankyrin n=1 Tax=Sinanodonta woodiana TaxID=1069815 RepID=A0ABD3WSP5_SINWO
MDPEYDVAKGDSFMEDVDQTDGNTSFLRAARDGNLSEVLEYLRGSTDINTSNPNGLNALHLASKEGHLIIVTELLNRGANVEAATKKGNTALHIASLAGHKDIVKLLVERGAKVNVQAQTGFTPLYMASQEGHAEVVTFLLNNGANQSLATVDGFTPLAVALQQGHERVVTVLLEHDTKGKVRLPALHIAAKKDDTKSAALLLQNEQNNVDLQTKSGFTPLHIAAHYGNVNVATLLTQKGADVNFHAKNNITPLHVAARWGKANMVTLLLDNKAVIDEKTKDGLTPLHCAARSGHENVVDLLLERGAPYQSKTKNGLTPLHVAAQGDHMDCARLLLYHKAPVDDVTVDYLTPLHVAAHCGNVKTAKLLLDRKCDANARALNGFTPLHIACKKNRIKVVELLLKYGASIEATTESGLSPLHVASFMGHMNIAIYLIQHNANPDYPTVRGETALHLAARAQQTDIIRILLRNGASVDAKAREQQTPLHIAARLGNVDNVVLLLQHGASPDATTKDLYTPLHIAAKEGHEEVASVLLEHGANHALTTKKGFTPLHIAAKYGNIKVARLLLQKDANPDVQGKNGLTPLHVATHYNHVNVALLLLDHKASPHATAKNGYTPLHIAAKKNQMEIATTLLEYGAKPDAESKTGFTPIHLAAQEGHTDMVSLLLEHKANVGTKAHNGLTPLHLAAQEDRVNVAEVLVKYGADIDPQTKAGYTPLHTSCHFGQANMVRFLLDHQASVNSTTKLGYTPLHQAAQQGQVLVVNMLLKNKASPNAVTNNGQTALSIAQRLGYISVVDILKGVTEVTETVPFSEDKYKVVSPETMQEAFLSDSEEEGGDDFMPQSPLFGKPLAEQHIYLTSYDGTKPREDSISLERGGSSSPLDTSYDKDVILRHHESEDVRRRLKSEMSTALHYPSYLERGPDYEAEMRYFTTDTLSPTDKDYMESHLVERYEAPILASQPDNRYHGGTAKTEHGRYSSYSGSSFNTHFDPDNVAIDRSPVYSGFLISFMVDARGGAMRGCRHSGVRIIIPPKKASMPTRITCRLIKKEKLLHPPPMNEGEALACRILEMGPTGTKFLGPIVIEVPHFASLREREREMQILRSDNGETWYEHPLIATEDAVQDAMSGTMEDLEGDDDLVAKRIARILTSDLPMYFAIVTRVRMENQQIGDEGGVLSSTVVPQVQAVFPSGALNKKIRVGLQAQPVQAELVTKMFGNRVAVSPIVTIEPRRRKFHKAITLTIPVPKAAQKGMINQYQTENPSLRLLCSIAGGANSSVWEDITENKNLQFVNDCVSFSTTVSARFWLMDCQNIQDTARMASELYKEAIMVPYMAKFVVFAKRTSVEEGKLRMFCMTDDKIDKTLEKQEHFSEVARSRDVEVLEGRAQFIEMAGNLIPVTKSGDQLFIPFKAFRENRLPCTVRIRDQDQESAARVAFMKEPKVARGEVPQTPLCNLNITLPGWSKSSSMELDGDSALELKKRHSLLREHGIVLEDTVSSAQIKLTDVADTLQGDWVILAQQLDISSSEINDIKSNYSTVSDQALAILQLWVEKNRERATGNALERALRQINREDVVKKCMYNIERVEDEVERAAAKVAMDQSGFDTFTEEVGISRDSSLKKGISLDVQFDEQDMVKDSESAAEDESSEGEQQRLHLNRPAPQAQAEEELEEPIVAVEEQLVATQIVHGEGAIPRTGAFEDEEELSNAPEPSQETSTDSVDNLAERLEAEKIQWQPEEQPEAAENFEETVFDSAMGGDELCYEEVLDNGTVVRHRRIRHGPEKFVTFGSIENMEFVEEEGPMREAVDLEEKEEILEDGTIHKTQKVRHHSLRHIRTSWKSSDGEEDVCEDKDVEVPGTSKEEILEIFDAPPKSITKVEDEETVLPDGTKVKRQVIYNRMVHHVKTHRKSFDQEGKVEDEDYEMEEIIPGTETAFVQGHDSSSSSSSSFTDEEGEEDFIEAEIGQVEEVLDDGTVVLRSIVESHESHKSRSRSGSVEIDQTRKIREERISPSPSPRSGSPVEFGDATSEEFAAHIVRKTIRQAHIQAKETQRDDTIETDIDVFSDQYLPQSKAIGEADDGRAALPDQEPEWKEIGEAALNKRVVKKVTYVDGQPVLEYISAVGSGVPEDKEGAPTITITEDDSVPFDEDVYYSYQKALEQSIAKDRERISSIDEDDGTTEYDVTEHMDMLAHGIPDHFAQKPGPVFIDPEIGDSDEDEVLVYDPQTG